MGMTPERCALCNLHRRYGRSAYCEEHYAWIQSVNKQLNAINKVLKWERQKLIKRFWQLSKREKCDVCRVRLTDGRGSDARNIDHCHDTGIVRGALCRRCNMTIGWADDDPERLVNLAIYIEKHAKMAIR